MKREQVSTIITDSIELKKIEDELIEYIWKVSRSYRISNLNTSLAIDKIKSATQSLMGNIDPRQAKKFEENEYLRIMEVIKEMGKGRSFVLLARKEDGSGVYELMTGKEFKFDR
jgi:hypothetical protein